MKKITSAIALFFCIYHSAAQAVGTVSIENTQIDTAATVEDYNRVFTKTEIEPAFPGGQEAWKRFLEKNLKYPKKTTQKNFQGAVVLQFHIAKDGAIQDIEAVTGPEEFRQAAVDAMKKSPKWTPARQNGRVVKFYKQLPVYFKQP
jgi:periplasmic protein TonB